VLEDGLDDNGMDIDLIDVTKLIAENLTETKPLPSPLA